MGQALGLTARDMNDMSRLAQLAANPQGTTREEIYLAVASLYRVQGSHLSPRERELMREILRKLTHDVEMAIRIALAEKLADDVTAPHDLILLLADDAIEVARPIIMRSALISEQDVLRLIADASADHHTAIATRPNITEPITNELVKSETESVLLALVRNVTARIASQAYETLVEKSRTIASIQEPLVHRADLPPELATRMCTFVSDALKSHIVRNYKISEEKLTRQLDSAVKLVKIPPPAPKAVPTDGAQKLVDKLAGAGQLKAGFLLRVLHQGQSDLFDLAFAKLLDVPLPETRKILFESGPQAVALACRAVGIDKSVFKTVYNLSRQSRGLSSALTNEQSMQVESVFSAYPDRTTALARLKERMAATPSTVALFNPALG
ncbi:MAG TPA: DUF2336 domain-containing protein [Rhizomicrobium sp.]|jgi:uncharacterized protein (DUF2336 family)|nr:DUF2336 domain-containing protein [Rhizomicrobium sp.]